VYVSDAAVAAAADDSVVENSRFFNNSCVRRNAIEVDFQATEARMKAMIAKTSRANVVLYG
jgi:hypothetical protein